MKSFPAFRRLCAWTHLPAALLVALLQRTPAASLVAAADDFVIGSPVATLLKSAAAAMASLGAMQTLAGATVLSATATSPVAATVGIAINPIAFTVTNTMDIGTWMIGGSIPPGMHFTAIEGGGTLTGSGGTLDATTPGVMGSYGDTSGGNTFTTPVLSGTPTQPGNYIITMQAFEYSGQGHLSTAVFNFTVNVTGAAPSFSVQPTPQSAVAGNSATFSATATAGSTYQWQKNNANINGATNSSLTLTNVQVSDSGATYDVIATNGGASTTSTVVALTVTAPVPAAPTITTPPAAQTIASGSTVVFSVAATGTPVPSYQWFLNTVPVTGATSATLVIPGAGAASAGSYTCKVTNASGAVTTTGALLTLSSDPSFGHLINLSVLTGVTSASSSFTVGTVINGSGTKPLVIRADGPSLAPFGISGVLASPQLDLFSGTQNIATNNAWGGSALVANANAAVFAFPLIGPNSKDAEIYNAALPTGAYSVKVSGAGGATGNVIAELYDATPGGTFLAATPRLINVSVLKQINAGEVLTVGFTIGGNTARTVLVRGTGPALTALGVTGAMSDPQLTLFNSNSVAIGFNDNWGGDAQLNAASASVFAFTITDPNSKDAVLLITLPPGGYSAQVTGVNGSAGSALVEVYEVP